MLIDTHAHLQLPEFDSDRQEVLFRAWSAGLSAIVVVGVDLATSQQAIDLARTDPRLFATAGVHPHDAKYWADGSRDRLAELCETGSVVAIGEIGLDFYRNLSPPDVQVQAFLQQLEIAADAGLPVVVHSRNADIETYSILSEWAARQHTLQPPLGVMHCFAGDADLALRYVDLGFVISLPGPITYPRADRLTAVAAAIPLDSMVVETDCPFLPPQSHRGNRNEPAYISETVARIAEIRGTAASTVATVTTAAAARLFRLSLADPAPVPTGKATDS